MVVGQATNGGSVEKTLDEIVEERARALATITAMQLRICVIDCTIVADRGLYMELSERPDLVSQMPDVSDHGLHPEARMN